MLFLPPCLRYLILEIYILELHNFRRLMVKMIQINTPTIGEKPTNLYHAPLTHQTSKPNRPKIRRRLTQVNIEKSYESLKRSKSI